MLVLAGEHAIISIHTSPKGGDLSQISLVVWGI